MFSYNFGVLPAISADFHGCELKRQIMYVDAYLLQCIAHVVLSIGSNYFSVIDSSSVGNGTSLKNNKAISTGVGEMGRVRGRPKFKFQRQFSICSGLILIPT